MRLPRGDAKRDGFADRNHRSDVTDGGRQRLGAPAVITDLRQRPDLLALLMVQARSASLRFRVE